MVVPEQLFKGSKVNVKQVVADIAEANGVSVSGKTVSRVFISSSSDIKLPLDIWAERHGEKVSNRLAKKLQDWVSNIKQDFERPGELMDKTETSYAGALLRRCYVPCPDSDLTRWHEIYKCAPNGCD